MRKVVYDALMASSLTAVIPPERWFQAGAVVDTPEKPFVVLRWLAPVPSTAAGRFLNQLRVDVHDRRGSYAGIDALLGNPYSGGGIYDVLTSLLDTTGADGRVTQCDFLGHSGDQESEEYGTNYKFSSWQVIGVQS